LFYFLLPIEDTLWVRFRDCRFPERVRKPVVLNTERIGDGLISRLACLI
jgi:hypothetical protein